MRKFLLSIIATFITFSAHANAMCSDTDYVTIVLDPYINGTNYTSNAAAMTWTTIFPYGNVSGVAVCNDIVGTYGVSSNSEQYETGGAKCWCKMTHPAVSRWVFLYSLSSASACAGNCANYCGAHFRDSSVFRSGVFGSVAN